MTTSRATQAARRFATSLAPPADAFPAARARAGAPAAYGATIGASFAVGAAFAVGASFAAGSAVHGALTSGLGRRRVFLADASVAITHHHYPGRRVGLLHELAYRTDCHPNLVRSVDAVSGEATALAPLGDCYSTVIDAPEPGEPVAITASGTVAWVAEGALVAAVGGKVVTLDSGGTIAALHADGEAVAWTRDGAPRSEVPVG
jgi:hypothetical protein